MIALCPSPCPPFNRNALLLIPTGHDISTSQHLLHDGNIGLFAVQFRLCKDDAKISKTPHKFSDRPCANQAYCLRPKLNCFVSVNELHTYCKMCTVRVKYWVVVCFRRESYSRRTMMWIKAPLQFITCPMLAEIRVTQVWGHIHRLTHYYKLNAVVYWRRYSGYTSLGKKGATFLALCVVRRRPRSKKTLGVSERLRWGTEVAFKFATIYSAY